MMEKYIKRAVALCFTLSFLCAAYAADKPNFLILLTDDQGYDDFGWDGVHPYLETPRLDQLRNESVYLANHHVSPVCAPTRASLLTGRHAWRTGVTIVYGGWSYIKLDEVLFSDVLKQNGYTTGVWGKWHCGVSDGYYPWDRGFDETYMTEMYNYENNYGFVGSKENRVQHHKYSMDVLADYAIDFMERNKDRPFCAYVPFITPHSKYVAIPGHFEKYKAKGLSDVMAKLYGTIEKFDTALGRILDRMEELGLDENTVVIFGTDNGPWLHNERERVSGADWALRNPSQMRGNKTHTWENGIKSPWFVRWNGTFSPKKVDVNTHVTDIFPTLMELAGIEYTSEKTQDGASLVPLLADTPNREKRMELENRSVFSTHQEVRFESVKDKNFPFPVDYRNVIDFGSQRLVCRKGKFKLIQNPTKVNPGFEFSPAATPDAEGYVLIDLEQDPQETQNIIQKHPKLAAEMKEAMRVWFADVVQDENFGKRPEFVVGDGQSNRMPVGVFAQEIGGAFDNVSRKLTNKGDYGEFSLVVETPGIWEVSLNHKRGAGNGRLRVSIGDESKIVSPSGMSSKAGRFLLEKDKVNLRVEVERPASGGDAMIQLSDINFEKVN